MFSNHSTFCQNIQFGVYLRHIWDIHHVFIKDIPGISHVLHISLRCISYTSQAYILSICQENIMYISGIAHAYLRYVSDISLIYLGNIWFTCSIYHVYNRDISGIYQGYRRSGTYHAYLKLISIKSQRNLKRISGTCQL